MSLKITWLGQAAFFFWKQEQSGHADPYRIPDVGGYAPIDAPADIILVSHLSPKYYSQWNAALGDPVRLNGLDFGHTLGRVQAQGIRFQAVPI